ncbi:MBL fold metallo-hydrolase [Celerinatantimonas yamalensis]|uniref:MBL fold metallo-hydrolase n=1 Tax=Celerinatantimonas yamalensis TaxID=559956 RepID=A0ABW9G2F0_9GAMM
MTLILSAVLLIITIGIGIYQWLKKPQFRSPKPFQPKQDLKANHRYSQFHNAAHPSQRVKAGGELKALFTFLVQRNARAIPATPVSSYKSNLHQLQREQNIVIWMGHSTSYIQLDGLCFLVDPVFSDNASPIPRTNRPFVGSNIYQPNDIPDIDYLLITHDHWDHLDYPTLHALRYKVAHVITPLGIGSYLQQWGYQPAQIQECDWQQSIQTSSHVTIECLPSQHFSGRMLKKNPTLWASFALIGSQRVYLSGDSGYGPHFQAIGEQLGPFDIALLECGQYNHAWPDVHMFPQQTVQAAIDLQAKAIIPQHNSKFKLSNHDWDDPLKQISALSLDKPYQLLTPMIGQVVDCQQPQHFSHWWTSTEPVTIRETSTSDI